MSFFEVSPMGSGVAIGGRRNRVAPKHRGGISVGGIAMGGEYGMEQYMPMEQMGGVMMPMNAMGGIAMGGAMSKEDRAKNARNMKKLIQARAKELLSKFELGKNEALGMAKDEIQAELKGLSKEVKLSEPRVTKKALGKRVRAYRTKVEKEAEEKWMPIRDELRVKGLSKEKLSSLDSQLKMLGFGIYDMSTGCAWYDDLWSGVKSVGETALKVAPHLLPLLL
jgi:hypothetical protein